MKKLLLFPLLAFLVCFAAPPKKNDLFNENLKGSVKSTSVFHFLKSVDEVAKNPKEEGRLFSKSVTNYNTTGNMVSYYNWNGVGKLVERDTFMYDAKGCLARVFFFDGKSRLYKRVFFKCNEAGDIIETTTYKGDSIEQKSVYEYSQGFINQLVYNKKGEATGKVMTSVNAAGRKTAIKMYDVAEVCVESRTIIYDGGGNIIRKNKEENTNGKRTLAEEVNEYKEYDETGNWTKMNWYNKGEKVVHALQRTIKYY